MLAFAKKHLGSFIGDRKFYRETVTVAIPIMIQMGITNFVNLLDNVMVGSLGTESMSGVGIVNQFIFIYNLVLFGSVSAAGIFTAQFFGSGDIKGVRSTFRFKLIVNAVAGVLGIAIFAIFSDGLINLFLTDTGDGSNLALTFSEAKKYLQYTLLGLIPFAISQAYASTLKETRNTVLPMVASVSAVFVNLVLNALLIFGLLGFPAMGVAGAAIATSVSRFIELFILVIWAHTHKKKMTFMIGLYRSLKIPGDLIRKISIRGLPILFNECLWASAMTLRNQCYSTRGLDTLAATNISSTVFNVFSVVFYSLGTAVAIMVGNRLGAGLVRESKDTAKKMIAFAIVVSVGVGVFVSCLSPLFPLMYNVTPLAREYATYMLIVQALLMPVYACANSSYYTIRSGGKVFMTMLMDSGFMWAFAIPVSTILAYATDINIFWLYPICQATEIIKVVIALILLKKCNWARSLV